MAAYATPADLAAYLHCAVGDLPSDVDRLLDRATEHVDYMTLNRIDASDTDQAAAAKQATCQQVEFWIEAGEVSEFRGSVSSYSIGKVSMSFGGGSGSSGGEVKTAPRARQTLLLAGLLNRGGTLR